MVSIQLFPFSHHMLFTNLTYSHSPQKGKGCLLGRGTQKFYPITWSFYSQPSTEQCNSSPGLLQIGSSAYLSSSLGKNANSPRNVILGKTVLFSKNYFILNDKIFLQMQRKPYLTVLACEFLILMNHIMLHTRGKKRKKERGSYMSGENAPSKTFLLQLAFKGVLIILTKSVCSCYILQEQIQFMKRKVCSERHLESQKHEATGNTLQKTPS